jgi:hypothetical protein
LAAKVLVEEQMSKGFEDYKGNTSKPSTLAVQNF